MFKRLWVQIPTPDTGWRFFTLIGSKNCILMLEKTKNKLKSCRVDGSQKTY